MAASDWFDLGDVQTLRQKPLQAVTAGRTRLAVVYKDGRFSVISGVCNHVGGPLGEGTLDGDYVVCPWHYWKFHCRTGEGEPGYEADKVPVHAVKEENGRLLVDLKPATRRAKTKHPPHPLARRIERQAGPVRVAGISTTVMTPEHPRYSTSDALLETALAHASKLDCETKCIRLVNLGFRACEGFYSKGARACTWPCSITQMDRADEMEQVYEAFVHWADAVIVATPIRWGAASSLYYKMVERMNCIQNQETLANKHLLKNKAVSFIITGGQDNIQAVAGQMLAFFAEVGCQFPQFPYVAHSRGWSAEDMEANVRHVQQSATLHDGTRALVERTVEMARLMLSGAAPTQPIVRGGRKACSAVPPA